MKLQLITFLTLISVPILWLGNSTGALPENTGAPGDLTCGRAPCHNVQSNAGDASIEIDVDNGGTEYMPGGSHTLVISISNAQSPRNGFQVVALDENDDNIGTWVLTAPNEMKIIDGIGLPRKYVTHQSAGNMQNSWTLDWEAPQEDAGNITFYASVLDANDNGNFMGDAVYTTSNTLSAVVSGSIEAIDNVALSIYPNPAQDNIFIESKKLAQRISLYDIHGQLIQTILPTQQNTAIDLSAYTAGVYLLHIQGEDDHWNERIVVK